MFTGIVERIGTISSIETTTTGKKLVLKTSPWNSPPTHGESISISGCCLTLASHQTQGDDLLVAFDIVPESLRRTTLGNVAQGTSLNIERALRADSLLGGHQVQGHVDNIEQIVELTDSGTGERRLRCSLQNIDVDTIVPQGSITIDGVSLTIASVEEDYFEVALIPTTLKETTLGMSKVGDYVNIETDIIARTVTRVLRNMQKK